MKLPFTVEQFLSVFASYNQSVFPMQIVLNLFALVALVMLFSKKNYSSKAISLLLGLLWIWTGLVYHILHFTAINQAAYIFGSIYIAHGLLFILYGTFKERLVFRFRKDFFGLTGLVFIVYALLVYPILGYLLGHIYPHSPTFGAPCPITIFTFGILLVTGSEVPKFLLIIPLLWSLIGLSAAINLKIVEDFGLVISGVLGTILILTKDKLMKGAIR